MLTTAHETNTLVLSEAREARELAAFQHWATEFNQEFEQLLFHWRLPVDNQAMNDAGRNHVFVMDGAITHTIDVNSTNAQITPSGISAAAPAVISGQNIAGGASEIEGLNSEAQGETSPTSYRSTPMPDMSTSVGTAPAQPALIAA